MELPILKPIHGIELHEIRSKEQPGSTETSAPENANPLPNYFDGYNASKLGIFGSFPFYYLEWIVERWKCAMGNKCLTNSIRTRIKHTENGEVVEDVLVLNCGHFICSECRDDCQDKVTREAGSARCRECRNAEYFEPGDLNDLPAATHLMELREELGAEGIMCTQCISVGTMDHRQFSHQMVFVCTDKECSNIEELQEHHVNDIYRFDEKADLINHHSHGDIKLTRLCLFCRTQKGNVHSNHNLERIEDVPTLKQSAEALRGRARADRKPWHLSMVSPEWIFKILTQYFSCECGKEYGQGEGDELPHRLPKCKYSCRHLACGSCWRKHVKCPTCGTAYDADFNKERIVDDLRFISFRDEKDYVECFKCKKKHAEEFIRRHKPGTLEDEETAYCVLCFDQKDWNVTQTSSEDVQ